MTALLISSFLGNKEIVKCLLDNGADVNIKETTNGHTPLLQAATQGHTDIVKLLLEHGADAHPVNARGKSALDYARDAGHTQMAEAIAAHMES